MVIGRINPHPETSEQAIRPVKNVILDALAGEKPRNYYPRPADHIFHGHPRQLLKVLSQYPNRRYWEAGALIERS